jgi:DNA-binding response OmpR family regulator
VKARSRVCPARGPAKSKRLARILLIDDTPEIAELLTFALRDHGYEVFATGYTAALNELIQEQHPDALVLDCSGYDMSESLFDMLRSDSNHADLPVVIITDAELQADASLRARQARKVLVVPKPFTGSQVAKALEQLLRGKTQAPSPHVY